MAGKPILAYFLDELTSIGIGEFVLVIGHLGGRIEAYVCERYGPAPLPHRAAGRTAQEWTCGARSPYLSIPRFLHRACLGSIPHPLVQDEFDVSEGRRGGVCADAFDLERFIGPPLSG